MSKVKLYQLKSDGTQELFATFIFENGRVVIDGNETFVHNIQQQGIRNYSGEPQLLYPSDGEKFLAQLKNNFRSGYLNATEVLPDDSEPSDN